MTAPHQPPRTAAPSPDLNESPLPHSPLEPAPVSKHNLYVLIGCTALVPILVLLGPVIYPYIEFLGERLNPF